LRIFYTGRFRKDYKRVKKQGRPLKELRTVVEKLASGRILPANYKDHSLLGKWKNHRECHIRADWLLIYRLADDCLFLERTGSHSELFE
jgi:mRNA interferase YafQ